MVCLVAEMGKFGVKIQFKTMKILVFYITFFCKRWQMILSKLVSGNIIQDLGWSEDHYKSES